MTKKRANGSGSVVKKDGRWIVRVSRWEGGKRKRVQRLARTEYEAQMILRELQSAPQQIGERMTVGQFLENWLSIVRQTRAKGTHEPKELTQTMS